ncbi:alpha/beta fold hydrolase [Actinophytocola xanthii]|uniref:Alpha/beta hydrolase n=1 Tax=Actinophytocola xanthii TaxID=1912961 RepID=A0A1Q8CAC4_9PSEU|nr:alpha/beta hydrolase [Actinophytocola xanthii]OLF11299.1 alpha/beta hydrolase [Actinophytocola xanthii]
MAVFALVHGSGDGGWAWHLVEEQLRSRGHDTVAPDLPTEDETAGLTEFADAVVRAVGDRPGDQDVVVVSHSSGGFVAPLVAERLSADLLVLVQSLVPRPGETPNEWFANAGYAEAVKEQAARDGGVTGSDDPYVLFLHDVPRPLAEEAMRRERPTGGAADDQPWPLPAWPDVPTRFVLCTEDRFLPPAMMRRVAAERLGITEPDEIRSSHCVTLSRPTELADLLVGYLND